MFTDQFMRTRGRWSGFCLMGWERGWGRGRGDVMRKGFVAITEVALNLSIFNYFFYFWGETFDIKKIMAKMRVLHERC